MCLTSEDMVMSLGTSDTLIISITEPNFFLNGHVMCKANSTNEWISLLCFKNGSLTRERIRDTYAKKSWNEFNRLLNSTPKGNFGNIGLYLDDTEVIFPIKKGDYKWNSNGNKIEQFDSPEIEVCTDMYNIFNL